MAYETKDNTGSVFTNNRKESDRHPDRTGSARIGGKDYWVSGWIKETKDGGKYLSLAFKEKDAQQATPTPRQQPQKPQMKGGAAAEDYDDQIPFGPEMRG